MTTTKQEFEALVKRVAAMPVFTESELRLIHRVVKDQPWILSAFADETTAVVAKLDHYFGEDRDHLSVKLI